MCGSVRGEFNYFGPINLILIAQRQCRPTLKPLPSLTPYPDDWQTDKAQAESTTHRDFCLPQ